VTGADLRYSKDHLWLRDDGDRVAIGITERISRILTWVNAVALPAAGAQVAAGDALATIDSQKAEIEIPAPVALEVVALNEALAADPMLVRMDPRGRGWLLAALLEPGGWHRLLIAAEYEQLPHADS
jgi:glycine cleavage system H protein